MGTRFGASGIPIERLAVSAYTVPTDAPESDGTLRWEETTIVVVEARAGGRTGLGYSYAGVEHLLFDGVVEPVDGVLRPDLGRPGLGLELKRADAARYAA